MDERMKELVAVGASVAVNCQPCLAHHLAECERLGLAMTDVVAAAEVGMTVNRGAAAKMREHAHALLGRPPGPGQGGCGCGG